MRFSFSSGVVKFPIPLSPIEALNFYRYEPEKHGVLMVMAANWREIF